jgi:biopolymer transport protein ExbD
MKVGKGGGAMSEINITPLVDVVLVLLIIFMVITPLVQMGYDLNIPREVRTREVIPQQVDQVILRITQGPVATQVWINQEEVRPDDLGSRLEAIYKGKPDKIMFLAAERQVNYGEVMSIVDIARQAGGENLKIGLVKSDKIASGVGTEGAAEGTPPPAGTPAGS